ncbi:hypothetical protein BU23DRAFT_560803 [Bimuria novae-zelandiae CBS 107.79]|uniref:Uncharacterized protein n=1 Tax=Bimuria novae-zelandiae CBS 107.79 TaxID=1447943 RepID=A0A6A5UPP7_9PLEO|nr:hypothetical protein BU23DRAFT_560803 [Bimuria novae-zelandiae CBS 107.79]
MHLALPTLLALSVLAAATPLSPRQGEFHAVGNLYSAGGCTSSSLIFADPIFGAINVCQPLDRNNNVPPIVSYKTLSVDAGCTVSLFYDGACSVPVLGFTAGVNKCVQGTKPFESAIVKCPA